MAGFRTFRFYHKYFTLNEINETVAFYKAPTGGKTIALAPRMIQENMAMAQQWAREVDEKFKRRFFHRLEEEGMKINP